MEGSAAGAGRDGEELLSVAVGLFVSIFKRGMRGVEGKCVF